MISPTVGYLRHMQQNEKGVQEKHRRGSLTRGNILIPNTFNGPFKLMPSLSSIHFTRAEDLKLRLQCILVNHSQQN